MTSIECDTSAAQPCAACFASYASGTDITFTDTATSASAAAPVAETLKCTALGSEETPANCSGLTAQGAFGQACRSMCSLSATSNDRIAACYAGAVAYCDAHAANDDCRCLHPSSTSSVQTDSGPMTYGDLEAFVNNNQTLNTDPRCLFPACSTAAAQAVLQDITLDCPPATLSCTVSGVSVTMKDVRANSINVITQNCGGTAPLGKKSDDSTLLGMTGRQSTALFVFVGLFVFLLIGASILFTIAKRRARAAKAAVGEATRVLSASAGTS